MSHTIAVIGAGTMGSGIAHVAALNGYAVLMLDEKSGAVDAAKRQVVGRLAREVDKGRLTEEQRQAAEASLIAADWSDVSSAELAIEAVPEVMDIKKTVLQRLDQLLGPEALIATNTSSLSITEMAAQTGRPDRVLGMHFFNPAPVMKLVELVRGEGTSDASVVIAQAFAESLGKETVIVQKDTPGFIVNRILMPLFIEAMRIYEEGIASKEDIDKAVKLGLNHPMGPLTLADLTGLDIDLHVMDYLYDEFHDDRFAAPLVLRRLVRAGRLGRKTNRGFYEYRPSL